MISVRTKCYLAEVYQHAVLAYWRYMLAYPLEESSRLNASH